MLIRPMISADADAVMAIYREGIASGVATFEIGPPSWPDFDAGKHPFGRFVAEEAGAVLGWIVLSPTSSRMVYRGVAEVSVYVAAAASGRGVGSALMAACVAASEANGIWTLTASIDESNAASIRLHQKHGFRMLGLRERVSYMRAGANPGWRNIALMERRSQTVGVSPPDWA